jgi:hypothetical protein
MSGKVDHPFAERLDGSLSTVRFDYDCLPLSVAKFLKGQADRIQRQCASSILQIGKALLEAKRHLSHGSFLRWVEAEVCMPARTAQAYMRVATWASARSATVAHLSPSVLYLLSASSAPEEFVSGILYRVQGGEYIPPPVMRKELRAWRQSAQQERLEPEGAGLPVPPKQPERESRTIERKSDGGVVSELVAILMRGLSSADFARVRDIVTSDNVRSDPRFAENLSNTFLSLEDPACDLRRTYNRKRSVVSLMA